MMYRISEAQTRKELIDPQLEKAGWYLRDHSKVKIEIPASPAEPARADCVHGGAGRVSVGENVRGGEID